MRCPMSVGALFLLTAACPAAEVANAVAAVPQQTTIVRQTPAGDERLIHLSIPNTTGQALSGLVLRYSLSGKELERVILDVPAGGAWDTLWLPEPPPPTLQATLMQGADRVLWAGTLAIPAAAGERVVIPQSPRVALADLKPRMLRGTNYYPRHFPWPGIWREMNEARFSAEFAEMAALNVNTVRTFYMYDADRGLHRADGTFTPELLARVNLFLGVADRRHMKTMLCLYGGGGPALSDLTFWRRYVRTGVEPFLYDGRVLMWDLMNEPGGGDGPKATPELARWLQDLWAYLKRLDTNHLATVGLCWQFDQLWDLGVKPEVGQFHNYSGAVGVQPAGQPPVRNVADDLRAIAKTIDNRPLVIGEFGYASVVDDSRKDASEARQLEITRDVLQGVDAAVATGVNLTGVYNWCAFHFAPDWMGKGEQAFGVIRLDGTLKPAGEVLRDTYARWRQDVRAPWEGTP